MHIGRRFGFWQTLYWSRFNLIVPAAWAAAVVSLYQELGLKWLALPWLPMSVIAISVSFYLGFKNNVSYDRLWEARKIWGAIVNASRSWAFSSRDLVDDLHRSEDLPDDAELAGIRRDLVLRHVAWMDALRYQLRKLKTWEHRAENLQELRKASVPEFKEELREVLVDTLSPREREEVLAQINPAARLLANQSRRLAELRRRQLLDGWGHMQLQSLLEELMTQQGKAERIKNFPLPRQYATVNFFFAGLFTLLVPLGMVGEFSKLGEGLVWLAVPFSAAIGWVFLTTDKIGDWSENPFEGLANDVPISQMSRGIERDVRQLIDDNELPPAREPVGLVHY